MWRHASISGTVTDESGEKLVGIRVQAFRRTVISGRRRYVPSGPPLLTDDRGIYRIGSLVPGDYIVGVVPRHSVVPNSMVREFDFVAAPPPAIGTPISVGRGGGSAVLQVGDSGYVLGGGTPSPLQLGDGQVAIYPATFHPSATGAETATVISLRAGTEHLGADMQITAVHTVSVSGRAVGPEGPLPMTPLRLVAGDAGDVSLEIEATNTVTDRAGDFTFAAVPPGNYTLRLLRNVQQDGRPAPETNTVVWTNIPLNVGTEPINGLVVAGQAGIRVGGRIEFEGDGTARQPSFNVVQILVEAADSQPDERNSNTMRVDPQAGFRSPPLPGGRYYVRVLNSPTGWMFKSATADGRDVTDSR